MEIAFVNNFTDFQKLGKDLGEKEELDKLIKQINSQSEEKGNKKSELLALMSFLKRVIKSN
jgi:hypothetical protein